MTPLIWAGLLLLGIVAGCFSGLIGIGGGVIIVPALVLLFGFGQQAAQGTTLALLIPPIGILAAWTYFQKGLVNVPVALVICLGFLLGGFLGGKIAVGLSPQLLRKLFAVVLILLGVKMFFFKN